MKTVTAKGPCEIVFGPPSLGNFVEMSFNKDVYIDPDIFVCSLDTGIKFKTHNRGFLKKLSGESMFEIDISSENELRNVVVHVDGDVEKVVLQRGDNFIASGTMVFARTKNISMKTETMGKGLKARVTGEGFVNKFSNESDTEGEVYFVPFKSEGLQLISPIIDTIVRQVSRNCSCKSTANASRTEDWVSDSQLLMLSNDSF